MNYIRDTDQKITEEGDLLSFRTYPHLVCPSPTCFPQLRFFPVITYIRFLLIFKTTNKGSLFKTNPDQSGFGLSLIKGRCIISKKIDIIGESARGNWARPEGVWGLKRREGQRRGSRLKQLTAPGFVFLPAYFLLAQRKFLKVSKDNS